MTYRTSFRPSNIHLSKPPVRFDQRSLLLFAALTLGTTSATWAQSSATAVGNDKPLRALFTQADQDANKSLSADEAQAIPALAERFAQVDANGDGMVSETEFMAAMTPVKK